MEEREALDAPIFTSTTNVNIPEEYGVSLTNVCAKWDHELPEYTLEDISVSVKPGKLVALIGHVGAGKVIQSTKRHKKFFHKLTF